MTTYSGRLMTLKGIYRVVDAPSLKAAWAGVKRLEQDDADMAALGNKVVIQRERRFRGRRDDRADA